MWEGRVLNSQEIGLPTLFIVAMPGGGRGDGGDPLSSVQLAAKVRSYEAFLNDALKSDLRRSTEVKARHQKELDEFEDLERSLELLREVRSLQIVALLSGRSSI